MSVKKEITHLCLIANDEVKDRDASDYHDNEPCTSDDEEEDEELEYGILNEVYGSLHNYSKRKLIKVLLYYIIRQEGCISKIKDLKKKNFELPQENVEFQKPNDSVSNDLKSFQRKLSFLRKKNMSSK